MNNRLKQFLAAENITQAQFADTIKVVRASVSHVLAGRNNPSFDFLKAMMQNYPSLNMEWLMFGKGRMYKDQQQDNQNTKENSVLFPEEIDDTSEISARVSDIVEDDELQPSAEILSEIKTLDTEGKLINNQRKVSKVIILFDDGSYQEL